MKILAIDPATESGWALFVDKNTTLWGIWDLRTKKDESWGMKLIRLQTKLQEIYDAYKFDVVTYERPGGRNTQGVITQSKIIGQIEKFCVENKVEYRAYSSKEMKRFATGNGNCGKPAMVRSAILKLRYKGGNNNEADAMWLLALTKSDLNIK